MSNLISIALGVFFALLGWGLLLRGRRRKPPKGFQESEPPF